MFTAQTLATLVTLAGPDFMWGRKHSRPRSDVRAGLFDFLYNYSGGVCVFCDTPVMRELFEACHIVSSGPTIKDRRGYVAGNLATGCPRCNQTHAFKYRIIPLEEIKRPDLVPTVWPSTIELRERGRVIQAMRRAG